MAFKNHNIGDFYSFNAEAHSVDYILNQLRYFFLLKIVEGWFRMTYPNRLAENKAGFWGHLTKLGYRLDKKV